MAGTTKRKQQKRVADRQLADKLFEMFLTPDLVIWKRCRGPDGHPAWQLTPQGFTFMQCLVAAVNAK